VLAAVSTRGTGSGGYLLPLVVIAMWTTKYHAHEFMTQFTTEQEFIDAMFIMIILFNYGIWLDAETLKM
jgi:hypothetical protein